MILRVFRFYTKPNHQCTVGALLGVLAFVLPWLYNPEPPWYDLPYLGYRFHVAWDPYTNLLELAVGSGLHGFFPILFLLGTLLALFSPLGGIAQGSGLLGFVLVYRSVSLNSWFRYMDPSFDSTLSVGYFVAIVSTVLVITSAGSAIRLANGGRPVRAISRFAAVLPSSLR